MSDTSTSDETVTKERRGQSKSLAEKMITDRGEMLVLFCRVAGLEPFKSPPDSHDTPKLVQEFCQVMVDYIASGHFLLYERIVSRQERRQGLAELAEKLYPEISVTTEAALDFNDKYDMEHTESLLKDLEKDLSILGEALANRIDLEDQLIQVLD